MLKKSAVLILLCSFSNEALFAQGGFFQSLGRRQAKYFIAGSAGVGTARWFSNLDNTNLYDANGTVIKTGLLHFTAKNSTIMYDLNVMAPVGKIRIGLGINFEEFYLDKLEVTDVYKEQKIVLFDESFRFDKFYGQIEIPFWPESTSSFALAANVHIGYFGYTGVERFNFFGEEALAKTFFLTIGAVGDLRVYSHSYLFIHPQLEYKYFNNSPVERPQKINHKIFSATIMAGIRIDVSREK